VNNVALVFVDSFQHYSTAQLNRKYTNADGAAIQSTGGRANGPCLNLGYTDYVQKSLAPLATYIIGFRLYLPDVVPGGARPLLKIMDTSSDQITFDLNNNFIVAKRTTTELAVSNSALSINTWYYVEFKVTVDNSAGVCVVNVNGDEWMNATSLDTQTTGTARINNIQLVGGITNQLICDLYVASTTGGTVTDFIGPQRVDARFFTADGALSDWTRSTGSTNYGLVDDNPANDDTDYLSSSTVGHQFTVKTTSLGYTPTVINGVQLVATAKKSDAGTLGLKRLMRTGGTNYTATLDSVDLTYTGITEVLETNPATSSAFTQSDIETDCEWGLEVA
jgi:hypothetical protein